MHTDYTPSLKPKRDAQTFLTAFQTVKEKFSCKEHPGWCWVDPAENSEHIPLYSHDIELWAKYLVRQIYFLPLLSNSDI
jgi:hypothetical protein